MQSTISELCFTVNACSCDGVELVVVVYGEGVELGRNVCGGTAVPNAKRVPERMLSRDRTGHRVWTKPRTRPEGRLDSWLDGRSAKVMVLWRDVEDRARAIGSWSENKGFAFSGQWVACGTEDSPEKRSTRAIPL